MGAVAFLVGVLVGGAAVYVWAKSGEKKDGGKKGGASGTPGGSPTPQ